MRRDAAHGQHEFGFQQRDLLLEVGQTLGGFARCGIAIARGRHFKTLAMYTARAPDRLHAAWNSTADRPGHEGFTLTILLGARRFADDEPFRLLVAHAEYGLRACVA